MAFDFEAGNVSFTARCTPQIGNKECCWRQEYVVGAQLAESSSKRLLWTPSTNGAIRIFPTSKPHIREETLRTGTAPRLLLILLFVLVSSVHEVRGQSRSVQIPFQVSCPKCSIAFDTVATIGGSSGGDEIDIATWLARDSRDRYYAVGIGGHSIRVFDKNGKYLEQFGRRGQGPGEFQSTVTLLWIGKGDTLYAVGGGGRIHIFSPAHSFVRSVTLPAQYVSLAPAKGGGFLLGGMIRQPGQVGYPFHILSDSGKVLRSFGAEMQIRPGQAPTTDAAAFTQSDDQLSLWHWTPHEYRFEQWTLDGKKVRELGVIDVPGWNAGAGDPLRNISPAQAQALVSDRSARGDSLRVRVASAAGSRLILLRSDQSNLLWVYLFARPQPLVQVIDLATDKILVSTVFPSQLIVMPGTDLMFSKSSTPDGAIKITVLRLRMQRAVGS